MHTGFPSTFRKDIHNLSTGLSTLCLVVFSQQIPKKLAKRIAIPTSTAIILYMMKQNFFPTLNSALESEGLLESWALNFPPLSYDSTYSYTFDDGSKHGHYVSVYRDSGGRYERPVHYKR